MIVTKKVAGAAAAFLFGASFVLAYGATATASAKTQSSQAKAFEAPVIVATEVATPVEPLISSSDPGADAPAAAPSSLAALVDGWAETTAIDAETRCLATAVFYEARSESLAGQLAVANVVIARARSGRFPDSFCGVIKQPGQFGFVRGGRMPDVPEGRQAWRTAKAIAQIALDQAWQNPVEGALYFNTAYRGSGWGREPVAKIGGHIFYR
jgi:N-acetylmuramoyl-L-alanine amidase